MDFSPTLIPISNDRFGAIFDRLQRLFAAMDLKYTEAAAQYGFKCAGCRDNCCLTRFYHHTYLEYHHVREGFKRLDSHTQHAILVKADENCRQTARVDQKGQPVRLMCPLNDGGMCTLYSYRPMICRLHGIPHELHRPDQSIIHGPGCATFGQQCSQRPYYKFDRTPFYLKMALLEDEFKQAAGLAGRIKMTVAEMILTPSNYETH